MAWRNDFEVMGAPEVAEPQMDFSVAAPGIDQQALAAALAANGKSGRVVDPYMPNEPPVAVDPFSAPQANSYATSPDVNRRPAVGETARLDMPVAPPAAPTDPGFTVPNAANPDFGAYGGSASKYVPPQLQPATDKFTTPYYAAYTNDHDLAGAVMVAPGQAIRLVDSKTGEVVFQGTGPEAAQQAVGIANAVSQDKGRKAAWAIQADYGPEKGWVSQAAERYDPKKPSIFGTLLDIAAPFILGALFPPLGALASGFGATGLAATVGNAALLGGISNLGSGLVQGESLKHAAGGALTSGALSGIGAGLISSIPGAQGVANSILQPVNRGINSVVSATGLRAVLDPINQGLTNIIDGAGNVVHTLQGGLEAGRNFIDSVRNGAVGALTGGGSAAGPVTTAGGVTSLPLTVTAGSPPLPGMPGFSVPATRLNPPITSDNEIAGVDVVGSRPIDVGLPTLTPSPGGGFDSSDIVVQGHPHPDEPGVPHLTPSPQGGFDSSEIVVAGANPPSPGVSTPFVTTTPPPEVLPHDPTLTTAPPSSVPTLPTMPILPGIPTGGQTTGGKYGINSLAGTRASLSPIFSASLPPPTFGARTPRTPVIDQRYAIEHPEASFFSHVSESTGAANFAVPSPRDALFAGIPDLNHDGTIDALDQALWRKRFGGRGYADGGFAVGRGHGRSDSIDARLSDGEYVVDAETVALLGNGSSRAGADALDEFRVRVRRDKGRDLAQGRMSRRARSPHSYMGAR